MAENKEYKDVNFPIILTLKKYKDKRVKIFFKKIYNQFVLPPRSWIQDWRHSFFVGKLIREN